MLKRKNVIAFTAICGAIILLYEMFLGDMLFSSLSEDIIFLLDMIITRGLGAAVFTVILAYLGYKVLDPVRSPLKGSLIFCIPAFAVAVNNFPISCLIKGEAVIDSPAWKIGLLALECIAVALFEEMAFRGAILLSIAEKRRDNKRGLFISIILSSAVFAAVHLLNLLTSSPISVIMQIGYSFLIGGMCSVILLKTKNIWLCVVTHAIFNFGGAIVSVCGHGRIWDTLTVILTVIVAVATFLYMLIAFIRFDISSTDEIYIK